MVQFLPTGNTIHEVFAPIYTTLSYFVIYENRYNDIDRSHFGNPLVSSFATEVFRTNMLSASKQKASSLDLTAKVIDICKTPVDSGNPSNGVLKMVLERGHHSVCFIGHNLNRLLSHMSEMELRTELTGTVHATRILDFCVKQNLTPCPFCQRRHPPER